MDIITYILLGVIVFLLLAAIFLIILKAPKKDNSAELINQKLDLNASRNQDSLNYISEQMKGLTDKNYEQLLKLNEMLSQSSDKQTQRISQAIAAMQESNEKKLEEMRRTVDEKLSETLDKRLNSSFKTVSEQLSNVYKSLGEMKELSAGVTDNVKGLNRVLTNVKARGTWAEVQLSNILDETIPNMYETNVKTNPSYNGQVEFAVRIPNQSDDGVVYLPVDSKFPMEDYARLAAAAEEGRLEELEKARKALEQRIKEEARLIKNYISTPNTTPFAIMYLATEGLYAEITSSRSGIVEKLHSDGIMIAGPGTITALLNSLAMGFRTIAINKKANEVWRVLGAAKAQYEKFGALLEKARKKVDEAGKVLDEADHRNDIIQKNLKSVETLEAGDSNELLGLE